MAYPSTPPPLHSTPSLDPAARLQLVEAKHRRKLIDRAINVAGFNAWGAGGMAVLGLPFALFSLTTALMVAVLGVVSYVEFRGQKMLRKMDLRGPMVLAYNQLSLGAIIIIYAAWQLFYAAIGQGAYEETLAQVPELAGMLGPTGDLIRQVNIAVYVLLILGTIAFQGGMGYYYFTRQRAMRAYIDQTPAWVLDVQRAAA